MTSPRFTVVIPAYDLERFVLEAIESVRRQSLPDPEIVVVDDGSRDRTRDIVRAEVGPGLRLVEQTNQGPIRARERGLAEARGDYVLFLDGDDRLRPDALARLAATLDGDRGVGAAYGHRILVDEAGHPIGSEAGALLSASPSGDVLQALLTRNFISTPGQVAFRRSLLQDPGLFDPPVARMADWVVIARVAARTWFRFVGPGPLVEYRLRTGSVARTMLDAGDEAPHIRELEPAIDAVFDWPPLATRLSASERERLRRASVAGALAYKGQEALRSRRFAHARRYLWQSIRTDRPRLRELLTLALAVAGWLPPGSRRYIGQHS